MNEIKVAAQGILQNVAELPKLHDKSADSGLQASPLQKGSSVPTNAPHNRRRTRLPGFSPRKGNLSRSCEAAESSLSAGRSSALHECLLPLHAIVTSSTLDVPALTSTHFCIVLCRQAIALTSYTIVLMFASC